MRGWRIALASCALAVAATAAEPEYRLEPVEVARDTYVFLGRNEEPALANGGNVANSAFVVTRAGVVVIDTGPTARYAEAVRRWIRRTTDLPVVMVLNTHHHAEHVLGNQVYRDVGVQATAAAIDGARTEGASYLDVIRQRTQAWAAGTELSLPVRAIDPGPVIVGDHAFELLVLPGHTAGDLVILDRTTGVLFSGDLVFNGRAPAVEQPDLDAWLDALARLEAIPFRMLVPGHGPPARNVAPVRETRDYLLWLLGRLETAAEQGHEVSAVLEAPVPERFRQLAAIDAEYRRSVALLYPVLQQRYALPVRSVR